MFLRNCFVLHASIILTALFKSHSGSLLMTGCHFLVHLDPHLSSAHSTDFKTNVKVRFQSQINTHLYSLPSVSMSPSPPPAQPPHRSSPSLLPLPCTPKSSNLCIQISTHLLLFYSFSPQQFAVPDQSLTFGTFNKL